MFGLENLSGISKILSLISDGIRKWMRAYERNKAKKRRKRASIDPAAEFQRRYGGLHPDLDEDKKTDEAGSGKHRG